MWQTSSRNAFSHIFSSPLGIFEQDMLFLYLITIATHPQASAGAPRPWGHPAASSPLGQQQAGHPLRLAATTRFGCSSARAVLASPSCLQSQCRTPCKHRFASRCHSKVCISRLLQVELSNCRPQKLMPTCKAALLCTGICTCVKSIPDTPGSNRTGTSTLRVGAGPWQPPLIIQQTI